MSIQIRRARPDDAVAVAAIHIASWRAAYVSIIPDDHLAALDVAERAARYTFGSSDPESPVTWIAMEDEAVQGLVTISATRDRELQGLGEVQALYLSPLQFGTGLGARLLAHGEVELVGKGFDAASLWVLCDNVRARDFYAAHGWHCDGVVKSFVMNGLAYDETRYQKRLV